MYKNQKLIVFIGGILQAEFKLVASNTKQILYALDQDLFFFSSENTKYNISSVESSEFYFESRHKLKTQDGNDVHLFHVGKHDLPESPSLEFVRLLVSCMTTGEIIGLHELS